MVPAAGSKIKKTDLSTARLRESDAADPSEAFPRWGNASVPEKHSRSRRDSQGSTRSLLSEKLTSGIKPYTVEREEMGLS